MLSLKHLRTDELTGRLYEIRNNERELLVEFLAYLAELDDRNEVLALGFSSLFAYCTDHLGYSRPTAFRRTTAARLLARFPIIAEYMTDGRIRLGALVELRDVLDDTCAVQLLDRAAGRTEEQVKEMVAGLLPQKPPKDLLRRRPTPQPNADASFSFSLKPNTSGQPDTSDSSQPMLPLMGQPPPPPATPPKARLEPIAPELHTLRMTVSRGFVDKLEEVRLALSHKFPDGRLEDIVEECLRVTLEACHRRRRGAGRKTTSHNPPPGSRYIPTAVREAVWDRDGGQCTFIGRTGHRCNSKYRLEFHHQEPFARGGESTVDNLTLRCHAHNAYEAEQDFGRARIDSAIAHGR